MYLETERVILRRFREDDFAAFCAYAMDALSYNQTTRDWRTHDGIDLAAEAGSAVCAAADGTVYTVYEDDRLGHTVVIRHQDGYVTCYSSLGEDVAVAPGDKVSQGQVIGYVGSTGWSTGNHLHFSIYYNGTAQNPAAYMNF